MKLRDIERHLRIHLPLHTTRFHSWIDVASYVSASGVATITTAAAHGLTAGDEINIRDITFINPLIEIENQYDGTALASTTYPDDLTFVQNNPSITNLKTTVTIGGADNSEFNGTFDIVSTPDRRNFYFEFDADNPKYPNGSPYLEEPDLPILNGIFTVASVPDTTTFTIAVEHPYAFTAPAGGRFYNLSDVRITGEISDQRAMEAYTRQSPNDYWLFMVMEDVNVSKDRRITSDFTYRHEAGAYYQQETEEPLTAYMFIPATNTYTPVDAADEARNELKKALINALCAYFPDDLYYNPYNGIYYTGDGFYLYNRALYVHQYNFAVTVDIVAEDCYIPNSVAVHNIDGSFDIELEPDNQT